MSPHPYTLNPSGRYFTLVIAPTPPWTTTMPSSPTHRSVPSLPGEDYRRVDSEDTSLYDDRSSDLISLDERSFDEHSSLLNSAPSQNWLRSFFSILFLKGITDGIALFRRHEKRSPVEQDLVRRLDIFLLTFGCISQGKSVSCWVSVLLKSLLWCLIRIANHSHPLSDQVRR